MSNVHFNCRKRSWPSCSYPVTLFLFCCLPILCNKPNHRELSHWVEYD